mgnify:CR=1 FL=1
MGGHGEQSLLLVTAFLSFPLVTSNSSGPILLLSLLLVHLPLHGSARSVNIIGVNIILAPGCRCGQMQAVATVLQHALGSTATM